MYKSFCMAARLNPPPSLSIRPFETAATQLEVPKFTLYSPGAKIPLARVVAPASPVPA